MTSDNIAEYVGENNQFTEKPVTEYPPVIQDNSKRRLSTVWQILKFLRE